MKITLQIKNSSPYNQNLVLFGAEDNFLKPNFGNMPNISILSCVADEEFEKKYGHVSSYRNFLIYCISNKIIINNSLEKTPAANLNVFEQGHLTVVKPGISEHIFLIREFTQWPTE